jgi:putative CocE/NonD family hydrolase
LSQSASTDPVIPPYSQVWIPLADGTVLAGRLWLPADVDIEKAPVVLEWIPYRQSDLTAVSDSMLHGWFAMNGIAALRVDLRGSGNSDGLVTDEYTRQEQDDAVEVIAWAAAQPWCNGSVGMIGISWSGFAALQVAARRPPALKAIITCCSTDDRYSDDVHFMGSTLLTDGLQWGFGFFNQIPRPPDPAHVGERWREMWQERLDGLEPPLAIWLSHLARDNYWKHSSICEDYAQITCPVYAVGGWVDGYSDPILRMMEKLSVPRKGLIGPWTHVYPTWGNPEPAIGFHQECLRWWRHWLKGEDTGIMDEPMLRLWVGEDLKVATTGITTGGRWIGVPSWPAAAPLTTLNLDFGFRALTRAPVMAVRADPVPLDSPLTCGLQAGEWCPLDGGGNGPEFQADQRLDDGLSLCFDTRPLAEPVELVGIPKVEFEIALAGTAATLALRLCEVAPDGASARVTFGLHRITRPAEVAPGMAFRVTLPIKGVAYKFAAGRRIRLALSSNYWPLSWPEPAPGGLTLWPEGARLILPGVPGAADHHPAPFGPPVAAPPIPHEILEPEEVVRTVGWNVATGETALTSKARRRTTRLGELTFGSDGQETYTIRTGDPLSTRVEMRKAQRMERPGWSIRMESSMSLAWEDGALRMDTAFQAYENGEPACSRTWLHRFPWIDR